MERNNKPIVKEYIEKVINADRTNISEHFISDEQSCALNMFEGLLATGAIKIINI